MKNFLLFVLLLLYCNNFIEAQQIPTNAGIPGPENVLVVYKVQSDPTDTLGAISDSVKEYYRLARGIPAVNIVGLNGLTNEWFTYGGTSHRIEIVQSGDILKDTTQAWDDREPYYAGPSFHVWQYFYERIASPIIYHLNNTYVNGVPLRETVRYIVLCKGMPYKLQARHDWEGGLGYPAHHNVSLQSLLCLINNDNYSNLLIQLYNGLDISNPYYSCDLNLTMDYRFIPNHYGFSGLKISYLVSRLDGLNYNDVKKMIDNSKLADMSGLRTWILDAYPPLLGVTPSINLSDKLKNLQFEVNYDNSLSPILDNSLYNYNSVIGYSSSGKHANMNPDYIQNDLTFQYAPGAVFNTFESFNGNSFGEIKRRDNQGLLTEFIKMGGVGGICYPWEPGGFAGYNLVYGENFFPAYAVGYNQVDAVYQDMKFIGFQNVVVGDPLTRIYNYEIKTLASDSIITTGGDFVGRLEVPEGKTLTIQSGVILNFKKNSSLRINGSLNVQAGAILNFESYASFVLYGNSNQNLNGVFNFRQKSRLLLKNNFNFSNLGRYNFYNDSYLSSNNLSIGNGEFLYFHNSSYLSANELTILPGVTLNFFEQSQIKVKSKIYAKGTESNKIYLNINNKISVNSAVTTLFENIRIQNGGVEISLSNIIDSIIVNHVDFIENNGWAIALNNSYQNSSHIYITNTNITGNVNSGIKISDVNYSEIKNVNIVNTNPGVSSPGSHGISVHKSSGIIKVSDSYISMFNTGISFSIKLSDNEQPNDPCFMLLTGNEISNCNTGIYINRFVNGLAEISKNNIYSPLRYNSEFTTAINILNSNEIKIESNTIYDYDFGINLSSVLTPTILDNRIQILNQNDLTQSGIFSTSSHGSIRLNLISGYKEGILLGQSSPEIAENIITNNFGTGIYVGTKSSPNLSRTYIKEDETKKLYPFAGFNQIFNNGGLCENPIYDGSEIYINTAMINLLDGCNTISDDRRMEPPYCFTKILLTAEEALLEIRAQNNYWGNHPEFGGNNPAHRLAGNSYIEYEPYLIEPCVKYPEAEFIVIKDSKGINTIDTVFAIGEVAFLDSINEAYALASKYFYDRNFAQAKQVYHNITQTYSADRRSIEAYSKLFTISKLTNSSNITFAELKSYYISNLSSISDTLLFKVVKHLSDLCLVAQKEYDQAINNFSEVITQNPNTEDAFFAAIDILTTSLLDTGNTILGKIGGIDLSAKDPNDYRTKLNALIKARNNKQSLFVSKVIPTEYSLYQNYPNPFNPLTKIQYDLPTDTKVQLKVYDILGREVKTLVNDYQTAGRYNVEFNASSLASGVYIYQLKVNNYIASKKMIISK